MEGDDFDDVCCCDYFEYGDVVQHRLRPDVKGIVIGDRNRGQLFTLRLASLATVEFHGVELEHIGGSDDGEPKDADRKENFTESNVIDLAKRRAAGSA